MRLKSPRFQRYSGTTPARNTPEIYDGFPTILKRFRKFHQSMLNQEESVLRKLVRSSSSRRQRRQTNIARWMVVIIREAMSEILNGDLDMEQLRNFISEWTARMSGLYIGA